jgi:hypothetical protein
MVGAQAGGERVAATSAKLNDRGSTVECETR